jgi:murein DD-endopeptidase MepM/ murein hydrolase activator NlpD
MRKIAILAFALAGSLAYAAPKLEAPASVAPGEAVLVTVTGVTDLPKGEAGGKALQFFRVKNAWRAVFAAPIEGTSRIAVGVAGVKRDIEVRTVTFGEASVVVEEELANPGAEERTQIEADNTAIVAALAKGDGDPQWKTAFKRPPGKVTSGFGEWRTFNDGHRSQHLGFDVHAKEGTRVSAINAGTVTLVRDTFLAGKVVVVAHGAGIASAYFHLQEAGVKEGDLVERGQALGKAGKTGRATGPHLHLGLRVTGGWVDPASFFAKKL